MGSDRDLLDDVARFLFHEAELLDEWRLDDWFSLFAEDGRYFVPSTDVRDVNRPAVLPLVDDDATRLGARVERLKSEHAHAEHPRSRTRRMITNITASTNNGGGIAARANFVIHRFRHGKVDLYVGRYEHRLVRHHDAEFRFSRRVAVLDLETLEPGGGKMSIIV